MRRNRRCGRDPDAMDLTHYRPEAHRARRILLAEKLGDRVALVAAGGHVSRNYPAATYPFRASSHFLYLVGLPLPGAMVLLDGDQHTLFLPAPAPDEALWHGPMPGMRPIAEWSGCNVMPLERLGDAIGGREVMTLPAPDPLTRSRQTALLGREIEAGRLDPIDEPLADAIIELRLVHDDKAQDGLRRAAEATTAAHLAGMGATRPGVLEAEVRARMEAELIRRCATTAYGSIVTVYGEVLHNEDHHHVLQEGDLLLADVGAETSDGWAGDVTRTWPVNGKMSATQREMYSVVLAAQRKTIEAVRPGARYRDVHLTACRELTRGLVDLGVLRGDVEELVADGVHALLFPHGVGHLLGLDVHDMEDLGDRAGYAPGRERSTQFGLSNLRLDRDLAPGMAVTIEPGLYRVPAILQEPRLAKLAGDRLDRDRLAKFADVRGIRIEDDVLVTEDGCEVLTSGIPKEIDEVERAVGVCAGPRRDL